MNFSMRQSRSSFTLLLLLVALSGCGSGHTATGASNHLVAASEALQSGEKDRALAELSASIDATPSAWAYFERARLKLEKGQEVDAKADVQKGLEFDPAYADLKWLSEELKKSPDKRFKGKFAKPPGSRSQRPQGSRERR
jgi:hypothetical protein